MDGEDGLWAVAIATGLLRGRRRGAARSTWPTSPRRIAAPHDDRHAAPSRRRQPARRLDRRCPPNPCRHARGRGRSAPWTGEAGTAGTVAVVGRRQDGPAARRPVRRATAGTSSRSTSTRPSSRRSTRAARTSARSRASPSSSPRPTRAGRLRATTDGGRGRARRRRRRPDRAGHARRRAAARLPLHGRRRRLDRARRPRRLAPSSSRRRCRSATRATGSRRASRRRPACVADARLLRRLLAGAAVLRRRASRNLADLPQARRRDRPGVDRPGGARSTRRVLDAEVVAMSSAEAAEFSKLADTTYRDVNIALANEFAALRRPGRRGHPARSSRPRTASRTATSTSPASASAATASRSTRTSCSSRAPGAGARGAVAAGQRRPGRASRIAALAGRARRARRASRSSSSA